MAAVMSPGYLDRLINLRTKCADVAERRDEFLEVVYFANRWPSDARFAEHAWYWLKKLGGMAGEW